MPLEHGWAGATWEEREENIRRIAREEIKAAHLFATREQRILEDLLTECARAVDAGFGSQSAPPWLFGEVRARLRPILKDKVTL